MKWANTYEKKKTANQFFFRQNFIVEKKNIYFWSFFIIQLKEYIAVNNGKWEG